MVCSWSYQPTAQIASNNSTSAPTKLPRHVKGGVGVLKKFLGVSRMSQQLQQQIQKLSNIGALRFDLIIG